MYVDGIQYKGSILVYHNKDHRITMINEVPIEDYLKSTLNAADAAPTSKEAMASYVIAARTGLMSALYKRRAENKPWDITAENSHYQGHGIIRQNALVDEMVDNTKYIVLTKERRPVDNVVLTPERAEQLAAEGFDAKKILSCSALEAI